LGHRRCVGPLPMSRGPIFATPQLCCARQPDAHAPDCLRGRMGDLDDMLAYEMEHMPRQASADLIPWTERVKALKMEWDIVRSILGERVR
jgi:hypothetical protein